MLDTISDCLFLVSTLLASCFPNAACIFVKNNNKYKKFVGEEKETTTAGFEPARENPLAFEANALTTRPHCLGCHSSPNSAFHLDSRLRTSLSVDFRLIIY